MSAPDRSADKFDVPTPILEVSAVEYAIVAKTRLE